MEMETPFIVYGNRIKKGNKVTDVMMQYDVAATIANILGIEQPQAWTGRNINSIYENPGNN